MKIHFICFGLKMLFLFSILLLSSFFALGDAVDATSVPRDWECGAEDSQRALSYNIVKAQCPNAMC